jgi:hypothetical protein
VKRGSAFQKRFALLQCGSAFHFCSKAASAFAG